MLAMLANVLGNWLGLHPHRGVKKLKESHALQVAHCPARAVFEDESNALGRVRRLID
jgi:hypothetical protein